MPLDTAPVGLALIGVAWVLRWLGTGRLSVRTPADWAAALLVVLLVPAVWLSPLPEVSWRAGALLVAGLATFSTVVNWARDERRLWLIAWGLVAAGAALAMIAPLGVTWFATRQLGLAPTELYRSMPRLLSDTIHPNVLAGALTVIIPLPLALVVLGGGGWGVAHRRWLRAGLNVLWITVWLLMAGVLVLTQSRGGYVATAVATCAVLTAWRPYMGLTFIVLGEALALGYVRLGGPGLADYLFSTGSIASWQGRLDIWVEAAAMLRDFPLTGVGIGVFREVMAAVYPLGERGAGTADHAHNLLLQIGVDLGMIGLIAYLGLWLAATLGAWRAFRRLRRAGQPGLAPLAALAAGAGAGLIALMVHGMFDAVTWGTKPAFLAWAVLGLGVALGDDSRQPTADH